MTKDKLRQLAEEIGSSSYFASICMEKEKMSDKLFNDLVEFTEKADSLINNLNEHGYYPDSLEG